LVSPTISDILEAICPELPYTAYAKHHSTPIPTTRYNRESIYLSIPSLIAYCKPGYENLP
jgi:hypothetical protein